jgi:hypothetical protein
MVAALRDLADHAPAWLADSRAGTLEALERRGLCETRVRFPGRRLEARITAAGLELVGVNGD